jgi:S1-C subfamily serine protease
LIGLQVHKADDDTDAGVTVKSVHPDGAAAAAGLKAGDRLLTLDSRWTDSVVDCYVAASNLRPGVATIATILRDGKEMKVKVQPRSGL